MSEKEPGESSSESESGEPTVQELAEACQEVINEENCQELLGMEFPDSRVPPSLPGFFEFTLTCAQKSGIILNCYRFWTAENHL